MPKSTETRNHLCSKAGDDGTRVNNECFCYVAISDDISTHADFQVDGC